MPLRLRLLLLPLASLLAAACAPAVERLYVAPSHQTIVAGSEVTMDGRGANIWVENRSTVTVTVTSFQLHDCENVKNRCEVTRMNLDIHPGRRVRIATVQPANPNQRHTYRWSWSWSHQGEEIPGLPR